MHEKSTGTETPIGHDPRQMELPFQDRDGEEISDCFQDKGEEGMQEKTYGQSTPRFTVKEIAEHEDGSATFQIDGSKEDMQILFETFFVHALIDGIKSTKEGTEEWMAERNALQTADNLVRFLDVWEQEDSLDYDPGVKEVKNKLKDALKKAGV